MRNRALSLFFIKDGASFTSMSKYEDWIQVALERLDQDFYNDAFLPRNEYDIQSHLWHCLVSTRQSITGLKTNYQIIREYNTSGLSDQVDLAIIKSKDMNDYGLRTLIEVKETSTDKLNANKILEMEEDIAKMKNVINFYIKNKRKGYKYLKKPWIVFFCRGASKQGIGLRVNDKMEKLSEKYGDINFWWGPKCIFT